MLEITTLLFFFFNDTATTEIYTLSLHDALPILEGKMDALKIPEALDEIWTLVRRSNKYIDETMPWALAKEKDKKERLGTVLYNLVESLRIVSVILSAFLDRKSTRLNSSHANISYAVFCLKKKKKKHITV